MSRDRGCGSRRGPLEAACRIGGSGLPREEGACSTPWGTGRGPRGWALPPGPVFPYPLSCSSDPGDEAGGASGGWFPHPPALFLTSCWSPGLAPPLLRMGAGISPFSLPGAEGRQPRLLHISHRDSIGPGGLGSKSGWGWVSGTNRGRGL